MASKTKLRRGLDVKIDFDRRPDIAMHLMAYVFDPDGSLIERSPVNPKSRTARFHMEADELSRSRLFIAPVPSDEENFPVNQKEITLAMMRRASAYEPAIRSNGRGIEILPIPEYHWKYWCFIRVRVKGRTVTPVTEGGITEYLPVCKARVHICEVDRIRIILPRIPDDIIFKLRDDLLILPEIDPPLPDPPIGPKFRFDPRAIALDRQVLRTQPSDNFASKAIASPNFKARSAAQAQIDPSAFKMNGQQPKSLVSLPLEIQRQLQSPYAENIRAVIADHYTLIYPYLCLWPLYWPYFFTCQELAVVESDDLGRFETDIWYQCFTDKPDLYFWVEYEVGDTWVTVYRPPIACYTYWDYPSGLEVILRLTDPRVEPCRTLRTPEGFFVEIEKIGDKAYIPLIKQEPASVLYQGSPVDIQGLTSIGLEDIPGGLNFGSPFRAPFGGNLGLRVYFGSALAEDGITHYRWSYRKVKDKDGNPVSNPWVNITTPVTVPYRMEHGGIVTTKHYKLGPDPAFGETLFKIPPKLAENLDVVKPAGANLYWAFREYNSGVFKTQVTEDPEADAGLYELRLQLFKTPASGPVIVSMPLSGFQIPDASNLDESTVVPLGLRDDHLIPSPVPGEDDLYAGFKMVVRVDNRKCEAQIFDVDVEGNTSDTECGFVPYTALDDEVTLSFKAFHPGNFARLSFRVFKGNSGQVEATTGLVRGNTPGDNGDGYDKSSGGIYEDTMDASDLLGNCTQAAYAERLHVFALATNGTSRLKGLDAGATAAFALEFGGPSETGGAASLPTP